MNPQEWIGLDLRTPRRKQRIRDLAARLDADRKALSAAPRPRIERVLFNEEAWSFPACRP